MKHVALAVALGFSALLTAPAFAANETKDVTVTINLTPKCEISTPGALTFAYDSFQTGASTATGGAFTVKCTNSLPFKVGFDSTATPSTTKTVAAGASNLQLGYSLGLSGTPTGTGNGTTAVNLSVTGTMGAGQSGTCATGTGCTSNETHALYVVY
ncbi:spore coat protein U domain-containing protein [Ramlibacter sp.]|uniref:spore coat protein U domain-containing protein n=1 Tax=Ramlibacter sp. TaxID=1917967 RepID=UPI003D14AEF6